MVSSCNDSVFLPHEKNFSVQFIVVGMKQHLFIRDYYLNCNYLFGLTPIASNDNHRFPLENVYRAPARTYC